MGAASAATCSKSCSAYPRRAGTTNIASRAPTSPTIELSRKVNSNGRRDQVWSSTTIHRPSCSFRSAAAADGANRSTIVGSPPPRRLSASQSRNFPRLGHSVRGCRLEITARTAMRFADYTKVLDIHCAGRRVDFSQAYRGPFQTPVPLTSFPCGHPARTHQRLRS
jgi:hypothetical protein